MVHVGTILQLGLGQKHQAGGNDAKAQEFVRQIYKHTKVLDSGARGATTTLLNAELVTYYWLGKMKHI